MMMMIINFILFVVFVNMFLLINSLIVSTIYKEGTLFLEFFQVVPATFFFTLIHPIQGPRATQDRILLSEIVETGWEGHDKKCIL